MTTTPGTVLTLVDRGKYHRIISTCPCVAWGRVVVVSSHVCVCVTWNGFFPRIDMFGFPSFNDSCQHMSIIIMFIFYCLWLMGISKSGNRSSKAFLRYCWVAWEICNISFEFCFKPSFLSYDSFCLFSS